MMSIQVFYNHDLTRVKYKESRLVWRIISQMGGKNMVSRKCLFKETESIVTVNFFGKI